MIPMSNVSFGLFWIEREMVYLNTVYIGMMTRSYQKLNTFRWDQISMELEDKKCGAILGRQPIM